MRKKYFYENVPVRQNSRYIDVVSGLFADYYFSFSRSVNEADFFIKNNSKKLAVFLFFAVLALALFSLSFFVFSFLSAVFSAVAFVFVFIHWFAFKAVMNDIKENGIF